ncbi:MAG: thioredoxin family protein [Gemmatimonadaceae bacterium]|nr:thioredoxin family protein [Gemmatimonadaceae bacterium]
MSRVDKCLVAAVGIGCSALAIAAILSAIASRPAFAVGASLSVRASGTSRPTLALVLSSSCAACQRLAPVLARLSAGRLGFSVAVIGRDAPDVLRAFAVVNGIRVDEVAPLPPLSEAQRTALITPTVILLSRDQRVVRSWSGVTEITNEEKQIVEMAAREVTQRQ